MKGRMVATKKKTQISNRDDCVESSLEGRENRRRKPIIRNWKMNGINGDA